MAFGSQMTDESAPGWSFEVREVSAGVYVIRATDEAGRSAELTGTDPDELLRECSLAVAALSQPRPAPAPRG